MKRTTKRSACHDYIGGWTPEEGSPAWFRNLATRINTPLSEIFKHIGGVPPVFDRQTFKDAGYTGHRQLKYHWEGAGLCVHTAHAPSRARAKERILSGYKFDSLPQEQRCWSCSQQFNEA